MKKVIALFIAFMLLIVCSACSNQDDSSDSANTSNAAKSGAVESTATKKVSRFASVAVGDVITFGTYEQDNNLDNGPEPIEWMVLDVQDGKALLLSKYGLDARPYNSDDTAITWEKCYLRSWLNSDFLNKAFNAEEQSAILTTLVDNSAGQGYSKWNSDGGNNTEDKVFLLSCAEANRFFNVKSWSDGYEINIQSRVAPTEYAIANWANKTNTELTAEGREAGHWFLRSPGAGQDRVAYVYEDGTLSHTNVYSVGSSVRPALWLDLNSGI